jgi:hypothetical protein
MAWYGREARHNRQPVSQTERKGGGEPDIAIKISKRKRKEKYKYNLLEPTKKSSCRFSCGVIKLKLSWSTQSRTTSDA